MTGLEFASSLIDHLLWPLVVVAAFFLFRRPLTALIGRVTHYEGLGQKFDFGSALAEAEGSVDRAVEGADATRRQHGTMPDALAGEAQANPSFVIIQAWEALSAALDYLKNATQPGRKGLWNGRIPPELVESGTVPAEFSRAVRELRDLRNRVAHGQSNPTPGEALAYAGSAATLTDYAMRVADAAVTITATQSPAPEQRLP